MGLLRFMAYVLVALILLFFGFVFFLAGGFAYLYNSPISYLFYIVAILLFIAGWYFLRHKD